MLYMDYNRDQDYFGHVEHLLGTKRKINEQVTTVPQGFGYNLFFYCRTGRYWRSTNACQRTYIW